jgi:hypothetical protein
MDARGKWMMLLAVCCLFGCGTRATTKIEPLDAPVHAELPRTRQTHNRALQAELARIEAEGATPILLGPDVATSEHSAAAVIASDIAAQLDEIFSSSLRRTLDKKIANVWPQQGFGFQGTTGLAVTEVVRGNARRIASFQRLVSRHDVAFETDHRKGLLADTSYLDAVATGNRLLGLQAAEDLANGRLDAANERLAAMFTTAERLAREQLVALRIAAVNRRGEALQVLSGIAQHPQATRATHQTLHTMLSHQLERWPADEAAWIGDRALALHTYELIRNGYLLSLLTPEEIREYDEQAGLKNLASLLRENIDSDELFYLQAMRALIAACQRPFSERTQVFRQLDRDLEILRSGKSYPFIADQMLLTHIEPTQRLQALDRARCEAWRLAFQLALGGGAATETKVNPLTGGPFVVEVTAERVVVDAIDNEGRELAALVPLRPATAVRLIERR